MAVAPISADSAERGRPQITLLGLALLPALVVLLFAVGLAVGTKRVHLPVLGLALVSGAACLVPLILDQARPPHRRHILITMLSLSWLLFFPLSTFTQYFMRGGYDPADITVVTGVRPDDLAKGQLMLLIGFVTMLIGYASPLGVGLSRVVPRPTRDWTPMSALGVAIVLIPLGWAVYLSGTFGLIPRRVGTGLIGTIAGVTIFGISLVTLVYIRHRSRIALLMLFATIPPTMGFNFFTGSKGLFFAPLAMVPLTYVTVRRKIRVRWVLVAALAFSLFYPIAQFYREVVLEANTKTAADVLRDPESALRRVSSFASTFHFGEYFAQGVVMTGSRFAGLGIASVIYRDTPERVPYQKGRTIGLIFLSYVPRILWPGKPETTIGQWVTDHYGGGPIIRSATGPTWVGELYFNFGYPGVIFGMLLLGIGFRLLHETIYRPGAPIPAVWAGVIFVFGIVPTLGGGLIGPINVIPYFGGMILLIHIVVRSLGGTTVLDSLRNAGRAAAAPQAGS